MQAKKPEFHLCQNQDFISVPTENAVVAGLLKRATTHRWQTVSAENSSLRPNDLLMPSWGFDRDRRLTGLFASIPTRRQGFREPQVEAIEAPTRGRGWRRPPHRGGAAPAVPNEREARFAPGSRGAGRGNEEQGRAVRVP